MVDYLKPPPRPVEVTPRLLEQLTGWTSKPIVPAGLAPYMRLPDPEPGTITRARMADAIVRMVSAHGCITRDDLIANGFTEVEIAQHFTEAKRIARAAAMVV